MRMYKKQGMSQDDSSCLLLQSLSTRLGRVWEIGESVKCVNRCVNRELATFSISKLALYRGRSRTTVTAVTMHFDPIH